MDITKQNREYLTTTNRKVYNVRRKEYLAKAYDIECTHCKYHRNENRDYKNYYYWITKEFTYHREILNGDFNQSFNRDDYDKTWKWRREYSHTVHKTRNPNWKLTSKSAKQWMDKGLRKVYSDYFASNLMVDDMDDYDIKW